MLTRIYGTAYATKDELKEHLEQMEEAKNVTTTNLAVR